MDNVFLIQFLQGEINALEALNAKSPQICKGQVGVHQRIFHGGAVSARQLIIARYKYRIEQAELEMSLYAG